MAGSWLPVLVGLQDGRERLPQRRVQRNDPAKHEDPALAHPTGGIHLPLVLSQSLQRRVGVAAR
eukprot:10118809-Alexandrium_andersonii.AAC.1